MMGWVSNNDFVDQYGNLSLGGSGYDDGAADATHKYAKGDLWLPVGAAVLVSDTQPALTYDTNGAPKRTLVASTTHIVTVPFPGFFRSYVAAAGRSSNPHGMKVRSLALSYRVNTANLTSIAGVINYHSGAAASAVPTPTAITVTTAGGTLTAAANQYLLTLTIAAGNQLFITDQDTFMYGKITIVTPSMSTCDLLGASWRVSAALY